MSEVLIRGMEMPKNCWECSLSDVDDDYGRCCLFSGIACLNIGRQDNCPLIEVPTPHGRLIDVDELYGAIIDKGQSNERGKYHIGDFWELTGREIKEVIDKQPTIIKAVEEE